MNGDTLFYDLNEALRDAFRAPDKFRYFLRTKLGKRLQEMVSLEKDYVTVVATVVDIAEAEGWDHTLVREAVRENPGNIKLKTFAQQVGLLPSTLIIPEQEAWVTSSPFLDMHVWYQQASGVELRVCRIKTPTNYGTGFLIGPNLIITNYHVLENLIRGHIEPEDVRFLFDHKKLANGKILSGIPYKLKSQGWHFDASPPSFSDQVEDSTSLLPTSEELDYIIVWTEKEPGNEEINGKGRPNARKRGWIDLTVPAPLTKPGDSIIIPQYPVFELETGQLAPQPLKMTLDTQSVISLNANATRLRYKTNTDHGSSGSPCFTMQWEPFALHRGGNSARNDGIPLSNIQKLLKKRQLDQLLLPFSDA